MEGAVEGVVVVAAIARHTTRPWTSWMRRALWTGRQEQYCVAFSVVPLDARAPDVFEFGVTLYHGRDKDTIRLPCQFTAVVDDRHNKVLLRVRDDATSVWTAEFLFDRTDMMILDLYIYESTR
jgi:hypothetical protein